MESISWRSPTGGRIARQHPAGLAHAFHSAGDDQIDIAAAHALGREHHGFQSRAAHFVDRQRSDRRRQSGPQRRLPRGRLSDAGRKHIAENNLVDRRRFNASPSHGLAHRDGAELGRGQPRERPAKLADRRATGGKDIGVGHSVDFFEFLDEW